MHECTLCLQAPGVAIVVVKKVTTIYATFDDALRRLSTVQHADVIAVVSGGQVAEQGSHEQLLQKTKGETLSDYVL